MRRVNETSRMQQGHKTERLVRGDRLCLFVCLMLCMAAGMLRAADETASMPGVPKDLPSFAPNQVPSAVDFTALQQAFSGGAQGGGQEGVVDLKTMRQLLSKARQVKIEQHGDKIFLDGRVTSEAMKTRIEKLLQVYGNVVDLTDYQADEDTLLADVDLIKEKIEGTLNRYYNNRTAFTSKQKVGVDIVNDQIVITGEVNNKDDVKQAMDIAKIYNDKVSQGLIVRRQMIEIAAIFAKMQTNGSEATGMSGLQSAVIQLPTLTAAGVDAKPTRYPFDHFRTFKWTANEGSVTVGEEGQLRMDFSILNDKSAILARPHLATLNAQEAHFQAGGQRAIRSITANTSSVEYKDYGVILGVTPTLTTDGRIHLTVKLEFSVPAGDDDFITFTHEGEAILAKAQGLVLSGLVNEARGRGVERTPYLSEIPILKFFFGKKNVTESAEELVLIVLPRLPEPVMQAPYATSECTPRVVKESMWIHKDPFEKKVKKAVVSGGCNLQDGACLSEDPADNEVLLRTDFLKKQNKAEVMQGE